MSGDERCVCCDLPAYSCGKAVEQQERADAARRAGDLAARGWVRAAFPGRCRRCEEWFEHGSLVGDFGFTALGDGLGWRAECCA